MKAHTKSMQEFWKDSYLAAGNESYLEQLYEDYLENPQSVSAEWQQFFSKLTTQGGSQSDVSHQAIKDHFSQLARQGSANHGLQGMGNYHDEQQERVMEMIAAYRRLGHLQAAIDPLQLAPKNYSSALELAYYGFTEQDRQRTFSVGSFVGLNKATATLAEIHQALRRIYCHTIGFEYMHINRTEEVEWIQQRIEAGWANYQLDKATKQWLLQRLVVADGLEKFLGFKYVGQKRFSLEGGDSLIPLVGTIINRSAEYSVKEVVIGMAHRGRLNVLMNVLGKEPKEIFAAFEGRGVSQTHSGDVKYHLGYSSNLKTKNGTLHVALAFNPSHLEIVSPVVQGSVRARQRRRRDTPQQHVVPIQIHGDAAFAGQGVVSETFNMSQARWFTVGGSIHIVINNQVGFTTSNPQDARSTIYCTDVAKMVEPPILHVNADDPEAVYFAALFAIDYRLTYKRDVVIDLVCYRRHGHNEADEPSATQPIMYRTIKSHDVPYQIYAKQLSAEGVIEPGLEKQLADAYRDALDAGKSVVETDNSAAAYEYNVNWEPFIGTAWTQKAKTGLSMSKLKELGKVLTTVPDGFAVQPQVRKTIEAQAKMVEGELPLNWGFAESLAYASLLDQGYPIRLCGQDACRGTFAHRHAVLHDQQSNDIYIPLSHLSTKQAQINIVDSLLSEEAVLAFEYGYATAEPNFLVLWEAQFGDFANGAQVVIDQFISSGEQKWGRMCGLVMLLPHGYEGQGPEHSSARLERYLQLCAQDNMQVCMPTTPAQIFHLLRRQIIRPYRKPLIVMTPKSMLRNPLVTSTLDDLSDGEFQLLIPEQDTLDAKAVTRVVFCSGKVYYDLYEQRKAQGLKHVAIVRVEQLYPFASVDAQAILAQYKQVKEIVWCQEEPQNMGSWITMQTCLTALLQKDQVLIYAGRPSSASPAAGYHAVHEKEQQRLVIDALQ